MAGRSAFYFQFTYFNHPLSYLFCFGWEEIWRRLCQSSVLLSGGFITLPLSLTVLGLTRQIPCRWPTRWIKTKAKPQVVSLNFSSVNFPHILKQLSALPNEHLQEDEPSSPLEIVLFDTGWISRRCRALVLCGASDPGMIILVESSLLKTNTQKFMITAQPKVACPICRVFRHCLSDSS